MENGNNESEEDLGQLLEQFAKERKEDEEQHGERILAREISEDDPVMVTSVESLDNFYKEKGMLGQECGTLVAVRLVDSDDTYLGIYLGEFASGTIKTYRPKSQTVQLVNRTNPALFVPELSKIVFGYESWWGPIESEEQFREITDESIQNQWYVQALQEIHGENE